MLARRPVRVALPTRSLARHVEPPQSSYTAWCLGNLRRWLWLRAFSVADAPEQRNSIGSAAAAVKALHRRWNDGWVLHPDFKALNIPLEQSLLTAHSSAARLQHDCRQHWHLACSDCFCKPDDVHQAAHSPGLTPSSYEYVVGFDMLCERRLLALRCRAGIVSCRSAIPVVGDTQSGPVTNCFWRRK